MALDVGRHDLVFRGKLASASLKLVVVKIIDERFRRIPRQACLGLIEADGWMHDGTLQRLVFRGKLASASLKRIPLDTYNRVIERYSEASLPRPH